MEARIRLYETFIDDLEERHLPGIERFINEDQKTGASSELKLERRAHHESAPASFIFFDVDNFKKFNDTYGHAAGDDVLRHMVEVAKAAVREEDEVFHKHGEEFVIVCPSTSVADAVDIAERVRAAIEASPVIIANAPVSVTASFGVAEQRPGETQNEAIERADDAMYQAKDTGRNKVVSSKAA